MSRAMRSVNSHLRAILAQLDQPDDDLFLKGLVELPQLFGCCLLLILHSGNAARLAAAATRYRSLYRFA